MTLLAPELGVAFGGLSAAIRNVAATPQQDVVAQQIEDQTRVLRRIESSLNTVKIIVIIWFVCGLIAAVTFWMQ